MLAFAFAFGCVLLAASAGELSPPPPPSAPPPPAAVADGVDPEAVPVAPDSPRASLRQFFELCRAGDYAEAARFLDVPPKASGAELAQKLKAVLDRHLWLDPETLSPNPLGDTQDNLGGGVEQLGRIPTRTGLQPVRLVRRTTADGARWIFSRATVERVPEWYARLEDRWLRDNLPPVLLRPGPRELLLWQWLALPVLSLVGWLAGAVLSFLLRAALRRIVVKTDSTLDDVLLGATHGPLTFAGALLAIEAALPWLGLYVPAEQFLDQVLRAGLFIAVFWFALRSIDAIGGRLLNAPATRDNPAARSLVPLMGRIAKVSILIIGVIAVLSELGYPVASLIAGLGIGGVALALAAQKTVENLFGSVAIGIDRPLQVGDFVKIDAVLGTVESIGLRSTRIRTLDRTVVTIPNGKLADLQIESYTARDRMRLACVLSLVLETTPEQLRAVTEGCERALRAHPLIWPDEVIVRLIGPGVSSLDLEVMAWFQTRDFGEFRTIRHEMLISLLEAVSAGGSRLAYPTRTVHVAPRGEQRPRAEAALPS
ncbi:mechanosensitive ion channel family protein [Sorangium cellulosum]|uniref:mechanosensitive ion channel family protein n=1 Tax=Sorangium cellulosum TaxID=56 RepID=UPI001F214239|nr:mechanosensitive ion channel family protein [Sorangium cellulosum]